MANRRWTFMVWMAGDNDLEKYANRDLAEMKKVGSSDDVAVLVQVDRMSDDVTRRYFVTKGGKASKDVVQELGETNTGDPAVAAAFFEWGIRSYPAERVCAVIWNHGSGIDEEDVYRDRGRGRALAPAHVRALTAKRYRKALFSTTLQKAVRDRAIAYDDTSGDFLDNLELAQVLERVAARTGRQVDLLGFDACLMSMLEISLQVQPHTKAVVASQEVEPLDGWPYDTVLDDLVRKPLMTATELGRRVVQRYVEAYEGEGETVTLAALDMGAVDATTEAVDGLAKAVLSAAEAGDAEQRAFVWAAQRAQRFDTPGFLDLGSLCQELKAATSAARVKSACDRAASTLSGLVIGEGHTGSSVKRATGVSIYVPLGRLSVSYDRLALARRTQWGELVKAVPRWLGEEPMPKSRPARPRAKGAAADEPIRVLCVHGIGGVERDPTWTQDWESLLRSGIGRYASRPVEVDFVKLDDIFQAHSLSALDVAEATFKLGASGLWHGLKDAVSGSRGLGDTIQWTAGMVAKWASEDDLRAETRARLLERFDGGRWDLVAAHSLGSLVLYDTFGRQANRAELRDTVVLTFGSQIGSPFVRGQFGGRIEPLDAEFWYHAYNPHDPVFTAPLSIRSDRFRQILIEADEPGLLGDHDARNYLKRGELIDTALRGVATGRAVTGGARGYVRLAPAAPRAKRRSKPSAPRRRALIVGINDYPDPSAQLEGCVNDAYLMSGLLQEFDFEARDVRLVLNRRATASAIKERVEWLLDGVRDDPDEMRVLYYSGHGAQVPSYGAKGEVDGLDECLVPWDFDWTPERAILDDWFNQLYAQLPYESRFVAIFDCCHSGGIARASSARVRGLALPDDIRHRALEWANGNWSQRRRTLPNAKAVRRWHDDEARLGKDGATRKLGRGVGVRWLEDRREVGRVRKAFAHKGPYMPVLLEACQEGELAYEYTAGSAQHGAFTYFLAEAVRGLRAERKPLKFRSLVAAAAKKVGGIYQQTPRIEGPAARLDEVLGPSAG